MANNKFAGKYKEGTFVNGEGPVLGQSISSQSETKGDLNSATSGRNLKEINGKADAMSTKGEDKGFDIHGAGYRGPENWQPKNEGESNNFDIKGK